jgi:predicted PurR-regulated permease PerM
MKATKAEPIASSAYSTRSLSSRRLLVWAGVGLLLYFAHAAFVPVALALLLALVLSGPVEFLHKKRVPRSLSALIILVLVISAFGGVVAAMWAPAQEWSAKAPQTFALVRKKIRPVARALDHIDDLRKSASMDAPGHASAPPPAPAADPSQGTPAALLDIGASAIAAIVTFLIVTLFLLTGGPPMMARMTAAFVSNLKASSVLNIIEEVRKEVGHFYLTTTFINIGLGVVTGVAMWAWGMPTPYLWGAMAAVLNYFPYAGAVTTLIVISLVAVVAFDTLGHVLGVAGTYVVLATLEGQIVQPLLVGRRMEVNPLLIFLGLWFGGLFWGIAGIILATPTLVALKVIAEHSKSGKPMMEFLGPNDQAPGRDSQLDRYVKRLTR